MMILFPDEMQSLLLHISKLADIDSELLAYCKEALDDKRYDDVARQAFLILENRMRLVTGIEHETGAQLANQSFGNNSPLIRKLGIETDQGMIAAHRNLYAGAFGVYRNPTAHKLKVGYSANETREILTLVNMLLRRLGTTQSDEGSLVAVYKRSNADAEVQSVCNQIIAHFEKIDPEFFLRVGIAKLGLHSGGRRFAQITTQPQRIDFYVFTRGDAVKGVRPRKSKPRYGSFSHKRSSKIAETLQILETCRAKLIAAMEAGESLGSPNDLDESS